MHRGMSVGNIEYERVEDWAAEVENEEDEKLQLDMMKAFSDDVTHHFSYGDVSFGSEYQTYESDAISLDGIIITPVVENKLVRFELSPMDDNYKDLVDSVSTITDRFFGITKGVSYEDGHKLRHELICCAISPAPTDISLGEVFGMDIRKTPDFVNLVHSDNPYYFVLEVSSVTKRDAIAERFGNKIHSYLDTLTAINKHKGARFFLGVVIVTPYEVSANFFVNKGHASKLSLMWRLGEKLYQAGLANKLFRARPLTEEDQLDETSLRILNKIKSIDYKTPVVKEMTVTKDYIDSISSLKPDIAGVKRCFVTAVGKAREIVSASTNSQDKVAKFNKAEELYISNNTSDGHKYSNKSVVNCPLMIVSDSKEKGTSMACKPITHLQKMWSICMETYEKEGGISIVEESRLTLLKEAYCEDTDNLQVMEETRKKARKNRNHASIAHECGTSVLDYLKLDGLWAKGAHDPLTEEKRAESKKPLSWDNDLGDIDDFISSDYMFESTSARDDTYAGIMSLIHQASELVGNSVDTPYECVDLLVSTKAYASLQLISDIAVEISAEIKGHVKKGSLIVKRLAKKHVYLAIYPTKSKEHIFCSIYVPKSAYRTVTLLSAQPFRCPEETNDGWFFPFVSFKQHKLKNLILAPSMFICLTSFWAHQYDYCISDIVEEGVECLPANCKKMILYNLLVFLEDKSRTEEVITLSRYMYVDVMNYQGRLPMADPSKFFAKLPTFFRTRLELFTTKALVNAMKTMLLAPPRKITPDDVEDHQEYEDKAKDNYSNLINFVTGESVKQSSKIIQLFYLGYSVNKNKQTERNSELQLVDKLISATLQTTVADLRNPGQIAEGEVPKPQQFSSSCIKMGSVMLAEKLRRDYSDAWQTHLVAKATKELSRKMTHEIATLKASCSLSLEELNLLEPGDEVRKSKKAIETISENLDDFGLNPFLKLDNILEQLEGLDLGLIVRLFKKSQHGGLREISILEIHGRVIALYIETISRVICSEFENEILTHPENKLKILETHKRNAYDRARASNGMVLESSNSSDKTRWNQNLTMHALIIPLITIMPAEFHPSFQRCLNLWVNRHVLLPESVIELLKKGTELTNPTYTKLLEEYRGMSPSDNLPVLDKAGSKFLNIQTGMMQGILHYTSSLLHLATVTVTRSILIDYLPALKKQVSVTSVVSSDDSATIFTTIVPRSTTVTVAKHLKAQMDILMVAAEEFSRWFCLLPSVKSVLACSHFVEFNSEFIVANNLVVPLIKYVLSGLNLSESENYSHRFDMMYNQLTDIFSKGLPAQNAVLCQIAQGLLHYNSMGARTSLVFDEYIDSITKFPEPNLGFFPMDAELCPGLLGLGYSIYHIRRNSNIMFLPAKLMSSTEIMISSTGLVSENYTLKMGDYARHKKLVNNVSGGSVAESEDRINSNPKILYLLPKDQGELVLKMISKSLAPGVANSLKHGDEFLKSFSSSIYSLFAHCYSKTSSRALNGKVEKQITKVSILGELYRRTDDRTNNPGDFVGENTPKSLIKLVYPNHYMYDEFYDIFLKMKSHELVRKSGRRNRRCLVTISNPIFGGAIRLVDLVRHVWFGSPLGASQTRVDRAWKEYSELNPWLCRNAEDTLKASPFTSHMSLYYYLSTSSNKVRRIAMNCPPIRASKFITQVLQICKRCAGTNQELVSAVSSSEYVPRHVQLSRLYLASTLFDGARDSISQRVMDDVQVTTHDLENISSMHYKEAEVMMYMAYKKDLITGVDLIEYLLKKGFGMIVTYDTMQKKVGNKYMGRGEVRLLARDLEVKLFILDDKVVEIKSSNRIMLKAYYSVIEEKLRELGLVWNRVQGSGLMYADGMVRTTIPGTPYSDYQKNSKVILDYHRLEVVVERKKICLFQLMNDRRYLVSFVRTHDISIANFDTTKQESDFVEAWISGCSLTQDAAAGYLQGAVDSPGDASSKFAIETFKKRFNFLFSAITDLPIKVTEMVASESLDMASIINQAELAVDNMFTDFSLDDSNDACVDDIDEVPLDLFTEHHAFNQPITSVAVDSYMSLHPMWNKLLKVLRPDEVLRPEPSTNLLVNLARKAMGTFTRTKQITTRKIRW